VAEPIMAVLVLRTRFDLRDHFRALPEATQSARPRPPPMRAPARIGFLPILLDPKRFPMKAPGNAPLKAAPPGSRYLLYFL